MKCEECGGRIIYSSEMYCDMCGLVVDEHIYDNVPLYDQPIIIQNKTLIDNGLSTIISYKSNDETARRLIFRQKRSIYTPKEKAMNRYLRTISDSCIILKTTEIVKDDSILMYKKIRNKTIKKEQKPFMAACIMLSGRKHKYILFEQQICDVIGVSITDYRRRLKELNKVFKIQPYTPEDYISYAWAYNQLPVDVLKNSLEYYKKLPNMCVTPSVLAGAILYKIDGHNERTTQRLLSNILYNCEASIRNTLKLI